MNSSLGDKGTDTVPPPRKIKGIDMIQALLDDYGEAKKKYKEISSFPSNHDKSLQNQKICVPISIR